MKQSAIVLALALALSLLSGCAADQKENTAAVSGTEIQFSDGKITAASADGVEIDGTDLTITDAGMHSGKFRIALPGHEYMAVRLTRV